MTTQPDIDSLIERASKMADGMTVNREVFLRDVIRMAKELRQWRNSHENKEPETPKSDFMDSLFKGFSK